MAFKMRAGKEGPMKKNFGSALNFNAGLRKASKDGKLDNNPKFKAAVDNAPMTRMDPSAMKAMGKPASPMNIGGRKERKKFKDYESRTFKESDTFEPTRFSAEEKRSGAGAASEFYGKESRGKRKKLTTKKVNRVKTSRSKNVAGNLLNVKNKSKTKLTTTSGKDKKGKNIATKGVFRGKRTIDIDSYGTKNRKQQKASIQAEKEGRDPSIAANPIGDVGDAQFKGYGSGKKTHKSGARKATIITKGKKAGLIQEKERRKSGIGYRKTGRTAFDPTVAEAEKERKAKKSRKG
tara:strand:+ start:1340 stop:2215 length:876 start_codon:yes stop_codon:yes gene_type:complete